MALVSTRRIQKVKSDLHSFHVCSVNWQDTNIILYTIDGVRINKYKTWRWCTFIYKPQEHVNFLSNGSFEMSLNHLPCSLATKCGQDNNQNTITQCHHGTTTWSPSVTSHCDSSWHSDHYQLGVAAISTCIAVRKQDPPIQRICTENM